MKCDVCGLESSFDAGFIKQRKSFRNAERTVCPICWTRRRHIFEGWNQLSFLALGLIGCIELWQDPSSLSGRLLVGLLLWDLFLILAIIPHELGHAIAARLAGFRVFAVVIGIGKEVFKFRLADVTFRFHWLPIAGATVTAPKNARSFQLKRFFVISAGPIVNAIIAVMIFLVWSNTRNESGAIDLLRPLPICLCANLWILLFNLWPRQTTSFNVGSDGKQLIKIFSRKKEECEQLLSARYLSEAVMRWEEYGDSASALDWCCQGLQVFPQNTNLLSMSGLLYLHAGDHSRGREIFLQLLPTQPKPNPTRFIFLNNIAYADALMENPELLPEADAFSQEAYAGAPWNPAIVGTRGTVLVAMGQIEPGIKLLKESFDKASKVQSKATNACHLAIAHFKLGDNEAAGKYLAVARQLDSQCRLIAWTETKLQSTSKMEGR